MQYYLHNLNYSYIITKYYLKTLIKKLKKYIINYETKKN